MNGQIPKLKWMYRASAALLLLSASAVRSQAAAGNQVLATVAGIPMPGPAVRFDYQSLDVEHGRLYISHMNANQLVVFDIRKRQVVANLDGFSRVHGVIAVPEIGRVYASVTGNHQVAVVDVGGWRRYALCRVCDPAQRDVCDPAHGNRSIGIIELSSKK